METTAGDMWKFSVQLVDNDVNILPLSVHVVVSNDDLLSEILLRLPAISLLLFKSVSKRWLSLIKDTKFVKRRSQIPMIDRPSGLFIRSTRYSYQYDFVRLDSRISVCRFQFKTIFKRGTEAWSNAFVVQSCNGLLLCYDMERNKYYVYNPSINLFKLLPQPHILTSNVHCGMRMAFDPTKSPHYKVVYASIAEKNDNVIVSVQIQTYSSETGNWDIVCTYPLPISCFSGFKSGIYWNDAIHLLTYGSGCLHYKLDLVNERPILTNVQLPETLHGRDRKLSESRGCLLLLVTDKMHSRQLNVYNMRNGNSEWSFKYFVNLCDIMTPISGRWIMHFSVLCVALGEREEDSCMVIRFGKRTFYYNFVLKTSRDLSELSSHFQAGCFLFTASFASV